MKRYREINVADVERGQQVRLTLRHSNGWATEIYEGKVVQVHKETRPSIIGNGSITRTSAIEGVGDRIYKFAPSPSGWEIVRIDSALPPLPTAVGSVILVGDRAAALRRINYIEFPEELGWIWVDDPDGETGPTDEQLASATIVHEARHS